MADVAARAGVSLGTVSHVLNHPERVTDATRAKVEDVVAALGYRPNRMARSLAGGRSSAIGLAMTDLSNSLFVDIARGAGEHAESLGMSVLLADGDNELGREVRNLELFDELSVAGSMITLSDEEHMAALVGARSGGRPLVLLNFSAPEAWFCSVAVDNELGGHIATEHLLGTGRTRLVFVGGPEVLRPVHDRRDGFRRALAGAGLVAVDELRPDAINREDGVQIGRRLVADVRAGRVDGIVAASDLLAAGIVQVLLAEGISVPSDVAVVGYDNNQAVWDLPVPLTTVAQPGEEMGRRGARLVIDEARTAGHVHQAVLLQPHLVVRASAPHAGARTS
ncbi:LacI family DNA-binding transcriptional regulator [Sanguibacter sp. Leaf3]|uniref:LacI family DNA-binding transcriptional regulator n=1 Tax=Sanguibacter sp. Leaf3 TaxID=1736209 RepID=UPI0006F7CB09|nr:LacI family DNA-binding transcriptional regulator [Sanguibacter sp. Leaf3]KQT98328.1 transcriptional regulator [Sanguibacter sp. Leaf3]